MEIQNKKITRAKVQLQNEKPFFAYLIMNMTFIEKEDIETIGVDALGNCYYSPKFIEEISENELKGVLAHEVLHLVLEHLSRSKDLQHLLYNVASDLCVNDMLLENGFDLYSKGLLPRYHEYTFQNSDGEDFTISDINKKTANQVYEELLKALKDDEKAQDGEDAKRTDKHIESKDDGKPLTPAETRSKRKMEKGNKRSVHLCEG